MNEVDKLLLDNFDVLHSGIRGMKWGVRRQRRVQALTRGGTKGGPIVSRVRAAGNIGPVDFVRGRGIRGGAARKAVRVGAQLKRFDKGQATAVDIVKRFGSTRVHDLIPVRGSKAKLKTTARRDIVPAAIVVAGGALFAARLLGQAGSRNI